MSRCSCGAALPHKVQQGTVIVFREGITKAQAQAALQSLQEVAERIDPVQPFNPEHGHPVFYIP